MAERMIKYFKWVEDKLGSQAVWRLAIKSGISETQAKTKADNDAEIEKLQKAATEITGQNAPRY
jgi:hypothetical protein